MKKRTQTHWMIGTLALSLGTATMFAQQSDPSQTPSTPPAAQTQQQQQPPDQTQPPAGQNGSEAQPAQPSDSQTFSGTIVKSGDKYILQDSSGKNYDIDRQDGLKQYEGKQVRVRGTLDADGKTIHMK